MRNRKNHNKQFRNKLRYRLQSVGHLKLRTTKGQIIKVPGQVTTHDGKIESPLLNFFLFRINS